MWTNYLRGTTAESPVLIGKFKSIFPCSAPPTPTALAKLNLCRAAAQSPAQPGPQQAPPGGGGAPNNHRQQAAWSAP